MNLRNYLKIFFIFSLSIAGFPSSSDAGNFVAFSLRQAEVRHKQAGPADTEVMALAGITRFAGVVYDSAGRDVIIVGQVNAGESPVSLDDLVAALRSLVLHEVFPKVSIDKTTETYQTGKQRVRFEGGIENTAYGKALLEADIILKKLALGLIPTDIWGLQSYLKMSAHYLEKEGVEEVVSTRFWFHPKNWGLANLQDVSAIQELEVGVKPQIMKATVGGREITDLTTVRDIPGDSFTDALSKNIDGISSAYPELRPLRTLFALAMLAKGIKDLNCAARLGYWLQDYKIACVATPEDYPLLKAEVKVNFQNQARPLILDGGIDLEAMVLSLQDGDVSVLKEAVLKTRPQENSLVWRLPLDGWRIPGTPESMEDHHPMSPNKKLPPSKGNEGCFISRQMANVDSSATNFGPSYQPVKITSDPVPFSRLPEPRVTDRLPRQMQSDRVGGVMLREVAKIAGGAGAQVDLSRGNFSLIVDGENARLAPETFRKFITALWSVYYTGQDPGISIDPIERGGKKHLVRYIGNVINNDLGRVMREADYIMKKWAVGTEKPTIPGFKDVDALAARHGLRYVGASRRFWFVPEDMRFKRGGEMLLFDDGHMTLKTEYRLQNKGAKAEPADEAFAKFFTSYYLQIAAKYPVYRELFDYAKLVSLAKYLKEQGVPLYWFLMANKDLVLTEDSPGTVDALAKGSRYFEGLHIEGGVNLGFQGQYVYDPQAVQAVGQAMARSRERQPEAATRAAAAPETAPGQPTDPVSFAVGKQSFTAVPQHSLTSGRDRRGLRYQTDLAFREGNQPGLELVRYFNPQRQEAGEFGNGWHLLIPYRLKPAGDAKRKFLNAVIPEKIALWNLISGEQEILTFSTDRYSVAGYVPEKLTHSQVVGLFLMSDASYRLADKLGNEFWFDQAGFLSDMRFSKEHRIHFDYLRDPRDLLAYAAYRVKPADPERVDFLNVRLPKRMQVTDQGSGDSQVLTFNASGDRVGYLPQDPAGKYRFLALMNDTSFRLQLRDGTEIPLDHTGAFAGKAALPDHPLAKAISLGDQKITFTYTFGKAGNVLISQAYWHQGEKGPAPVCLAKYEYDDDGRLAMVTSAQTGLAQAETLSPLPPMVSASFGSHP